MAIRKKHWTKTMFIDKADLWFSNMNQAWKSGPMITRQIKKLLKRHHVSKGKILELGCGNGRISINMAKLGFKVTGVDISRQYLQDAYMKAARARVKVRFIHGDYRKIDALVRGKFDAVISIWTSLGFYDQRTDQALFKKVARLLKKRGIFLILFTMSRERLLSIFNTHLYHENDAYLVLNDNTMDCSRSIIHNKWKFYRKVNRDLIFDDEIAFTLRIYAIPEFVAMAENAGLEFKEAMHTIMTFESARTDSPANLVFQKP